MDVAQFVIDRLWEWPTGSPWEPCESAHPTADIYHPEGHLTDSNHSAAIGRQLRLAVQLRQDGNTDALRAMAAGWADHPDYDPAWLTTDPRTSA